MKPPASVPGPGGRTKGVWIRMSISNNYRRLELTRSSGQAQFIEVPMKRVYAIINTTKFCLTI